MRWLLPTVQIKAIVIGTSAGGMSAMETILRGLVSQFHLPILIVQHIPSQIDDSLIGYYLKDFCFTIKQADDKERIVDHHIYFAPPDYHLLVEEDFSLSLSIEAKVNLARPSIDVLFETAAFALGMQVVGVLLTGASKDGSQGLRAIKDSGGLTVVQDPETADFGFMPRKALETFTPDYVLPLDQISQLLNQIQLNNEGMRK